MPSTLPASTKLCDAAPLAGFTMGPSKFFSSADDFEALGGILHGVGLRHRDGEVPIPALVVILEVVGAELVDEREHFIQVAPLVPGLKALVDQRAEVQVPVALQRHEPPALRQFRNRLHIEYVETTGAAVIGYLRVSRTAPE